MNNNQTNVLIIEDDPDGRQSLSEALESLGVRITAVDCGEDGLKAFQAGGFDLVMSDLVLPDIDGIDVLRHIIDAEPDTPVIIMTAYGSVSSSVKALKAGAYDYLTKPLDLDDIQNAVERATEASRLRRKVKNFENSAREQFGSGAITAVDPRSVELLDHIKNLAQTHATVLIQGESGTGKELVARALHFDGARADGPFVAVNCGAFTESLLASELFGHEKGSFTGAFRQHRGAFERAHGGTLFLDEIADAPPDVQVKLLRVLETREVMRIGGQVPIKVDVRVVSATNRPLRECVSNGEFREDLLYRLNVVDIEIPPLRARRGDIRPMAEQFIAQACAEHGRHLREIDPAFFRELDRRDWPGNVRELRNVIESAIVTTRSGILDLHSLNPLGKLSPKQGGDNFMIPSGMTLMEIEKSVFEQTLERCQGNRTATADALGVSRRTIQRKIKEHNL